MKHLLVNISMVLMLLAAGCGQTDGPPLQERQPSTAPVATAYTVRLPASDPETQAIVLAQTVYPATREENAAGAIILCPQDARLAFTAMNRITHMPINAPLLYLTPDGRLSEQTKQEMKRLHPDGVTQDAQVQVYIVGLVDEAVVQVVRDELNYVTRLFSEDDPVELAELLDRWQAAVKADHPDEVVICAVDDPLGLIHGMGAMGWNAHMGKGFAWVYRDSIPDQTRQILQRRFGEDGAYMYLMGDESIISARVARELARYGLVRRIAGPTVYATNAINAGYKDFGRNFGWWLGWDARSFDWGISQAGHNFIIANADQPLSAIPAALLGHMGKHGPILLVMQDQVPKPVADYLEMVRPFVSGPTETIRNFAWIIGDESQLSGTVQEQIHKLLTPSGLELTRLAPQEAP